MEANICVQIERSQAPNATSNGGDASRVGDNAVVI